MNSKTLGILALVAAAILAIAFWVARGRAPEETAAPAALKTSSTPSGTSPSESAGSKFFPVLAAKGNDVAEIDIHTADKDTSVKRAGGRWVVPSKGGYPADPEKVRDAVVSVAEMTITEPKTQKPENYPLLGVQDPGDKDSTSRLVTLKDAQGAVLASLIVGSSAPSAGGSSPGASVYVRRAGEAQAFEVRSRIDPRYALEADPASWIKKSLDGVAADQVKSVSITHADGSAVDIAKTKKDDAEYALTNMPAGREIKYAGAASAIAQAVSLVSFDNVKPVAEVAQGATPTGTAVFRTFDGLVLTVDTSTNDGTSWATFSARYEAPAEPGADKDAAAKSAEEAKKQVEALNSRFEGWAFALPAYRVQQLLTKMDDLLKPPPPPSEHSDQTPGPITGDQGAPIQVPDK